MTKLEVVALFLYLISVPFVVYQELREEREFNVFMTRHMGDRHRLTVKTVLKILGMAILPGFNTVYVIGVTGEYLRKKWRQRV